MAKKLRTFVTAHERDGQGNATGRSETFGPDDKLPAWAEKAITNPDVWADGDANDAVAVSDPGNSGPASVDLTEGADERLTAREADSAPAGDGSASAPRSTRQRSGR